MEKSDEELVENLGSGDISALKELYDRYRTRLMSFAYYVLGDRGRAEDVLQETFLRVFRHAGRFRKGARFSPWAYSIAANLCRDELRKTRRRRDISVPLPTGEGAEGSPAASPRRGAAGREFMERLRAEIAALGEGQREAVALHYLEEMTYAEIAGILGCPVGTVQSRLHAALKTLRERLEEFL